MHYAPPTYLTRLEVKYLLFRKASFGTSTGILLFGSQILYYTILYETKGAPTKKARALTQEKDSRNIITPSI